MKIEQQIQKNPLIDVLTRIYITKGNGDVTFFFDTLSKSMTI